MVIGKAAKALVQCGAIGFGIAVAKQQKKELKMQNNKESVTISDELNISSIKNEESTESQDVENAWNRLKENAKGLHEASDRLTKEFAELKQVADANGGQLPDVNEIVRNIIGPCEDKSIDVDISNARFE